MWRQVRAVTEFNLRSLPQRAGASVATVIGIGGVVMVLVGVLSIAAGFRKTLESSARDDTVLVLRSGSTEELSSALTIDQTRIIADAPGVLRGASGPLASAELYVVVDVPKRSTGTDANVPLRGVQRSAFEVRDDLRITEGRLFEDGRNEIIVGEGAAGQFAGLELGSVRRWGENEWTVVGIFSAGGASEESELWTDARVLQPAYRRGNSFQAVRVRLESPEAFPTFKDALTTDPRLKVEVTSETDYYAEKSQVMTALISNLGYLIAFLMGIGAVFGALNTMYSAVSARTQEIATLRAMGFGAAPVVISVLAEALLLAALGAGAGAALAYGLFHGYRASTINFQTFSQVTFAFDVNTALLGTGAVVALLIGLAGGLFPALRAARLPIADGLRAVG